MERRRRGDARGAGQQSTRSCAVARLSSLLPQGVRRQLSDDGALMSFTVSQRTREIGVRAALGAQPESILAAVARRAFFQLLAGIVAGVVVGIGLLYAFREATIPGPDPTLNLAACSGFMLLVGMLACLEPTLRGLRIQPAEALNEG